MGKFRVTVENANYEVEAPDENTAWQWANQTHAQAAQPAFSRSKFPEAGARTDIPKPEENLTPAEKITRNPLTRFALGAASPVLGAAQLATRSPLPHVLGLDKLVDEQVARIEALKGQGLDLAGIAGNVMNPAGLSAIGKIPQAVGLGRKMLQSAGIGGGYALTTPTEGGDEFLGNKAAQVATGLGVGAAIPPAISAVTAPVKAARNILQPLLPGGIEKVAGRQANLAAGDRRPQVLQALDDATELVPGSRPTAGEAAVPAGSTEFAGLQRLVANLKPSEYRDISKGQDAARLSAVRSVGQTPKALATAEGQRAAEAVKNYGAAYSEFVKADETLLKLAENPYFKDALPDAARIAQAKGITPKENLIEFLQGVKISLDKSIMKTGDTALSNTERRQAFQVRNELAKWLDDKSPAYKAARAKFKEQSEPINQMQVGQYLEGKLQPALNDLGASGSQRAAMYGQALRDAPGTIKRSTGFNRFDELSDVLNPGQVAAVRGVGSDLARKAEYESMAQVGTEAARKQLGAIEPMRLPNALHRPIMIANAVLNRVQGKAEGQTLDMLAKAMQDPKELARIMRAAGPSEKLQVMRAAHYFKTLPKLTAAAAGASQ